MFEDLLEKMELDRAAVGAFLKMAGLDLSGEFLVVVSMNGEHSPRRAKVRFQPSAETDNIIHHVVQKIGDVGRMERLEIRRADGTEGFVRVLPIAEDVQTEFK